MWAFIVGGIVVIVGGVVWLVLKSRPKTPDYDRIIGHLEDKIFPGGAAQKKEGARQVMLLLKSKINIQEAEELYVRKISLFYFEKYDSKNYDLINHLTKYENTKVDFFDKIELYNYFAQEHIRFNKQTWVDGFALHEIIVNVRGKAVDYRFLDVNQDFEKLTGLTKSEVVGRTVKQIFPRIDEFWVNTYSKVALNGELAKFDHFDESLNKNLSVTAYSPKPKQFISFLKENKGQNSNHVVKRA